VAFSFAWRRETRDNEFMAYPNFQSLEADNQRRIKRFLRTMTVIAMALTLAHIVVVLVNQRGFDSLIGTFGSLLLLLTNQFEDNVFQIMILLISLGCLLVSAIR
jgi:hypothetical protein